MAITKAKTQKANSHKSIVICEYISTGINYVEDAWARGYEPILLEGSYVGSDDDVQRLRNFRNLINKRMEDKVRIIPEMDDYDAVLKQVKEIDPALVIAGSEFGVPLATRLASDLGLLGNPVERISYMTDKDAMQQALKDYGIRSIRGEVVRSEAEAIAFYKQLGKEDVVVKPLRGAASQGVYICHGEEEMLEGVRKHLAQCLENGAQEAEPREAAREAAVLIQERIIGTEYVVNTVSCQGKHRVVTAGVYDKYRMANGTIAYNYFRYLTHLDIGHAALMQYAYQAMDAIGIQYGPVHGEYMIDEAGPVLIEVNCRPMGGGLEIEYSEMISGQHETDSALDGYLDPEKFLKDARKPYRLKRGGVSKDIVLAKDIVITSAPVLQICRRLRSYYSASFAEIGKTDLLHQTQDMETDAGLVYLIHDDEQQVKDDCALLHVLETDYPNLLFQEASAPSEVQNATQSAAPGGAKKVKRDIDGIIETANCCGATLIFSDTLSHHDRAAVATTDTLKAAYNAYDQGILDLSELTSFTDLESAVEQIFTFMDKIRIGGRIFIPESTYCHLPYGMTGMEILLKVAGETIELPMASMPGLLVATIR